MKAFITIDGGTTNTRITLSREGNVLGQKKLPYGARRGADDPDAYRTGIADALHALLRECDHTEQELERILASGMITSEFGLYNLPHIPAPAGIAELHNGMHEVCIPQISSIPIVFLPGVKRIGETALLTDMMRGEETELFGMTEHPLSNCLYVLPGSHSKLIETDLAGRILRFETTLSGEMLRALSEGTILSDAVRLKESSLVPNMLTEGYLAAHAHGLNTALFKTRILKNLFDKNKDETYSFFTGAVLSAEINSIISAKTERVVLGGNSHIKEAMAHLLRAYCTKALTVVDDRDVDAAPMRGAIRIYTGK